MKGSKLSRKGKADKPAAEGIIKFFGLRNEMAFLKKGMKVPPVEKLKWLEEIRRSLCRLPPKIGRRVFEELKEGK